MSWSSSNALNIHSIYYTSWKLVCFCVCSPSSDLPPLAVAVNLITAAPESALGIVAFRDTQLLFTGWSPFGHSRRLMLSPLKFWHFPALRFSSTRWPNLQLAISNISPFLLLLHLEAWAAQLTHLSQAWTPQLTITISCVNYPSRIWEAIFVS
jgi:hypothetical protein